MPSTRLSRSVHVGTALWWFLLHFVTADFVSPGNSPFFRPTSLVRQRLWRHDDDDDDTWADWTWRLRHRWSSRWDSGESSASTSIAVSMGSEANDSNDRETVCRTNDWSTGLTALMAWVWTQCPSQNQLVILFLTILLLQEYWSRVPFWLQNLILYPWRKLVVAPIRRWQRRRRQRLSEQLINIHLAEAQLNDADSGSALSATSGSPLLNVEAKPASPVQEKLFFQGSEDDQDGDGLDDTDYGSSLLGKLHKIMTLVSAATHSTMSELTQSSNFDTPFAMEVTLLVMLQMVRQSRRTTAALWDEFYASAGQPLFATTVPRAVSFDTESVVAPPRREQVVPTLIENLQFSEWAYLEETSSIQAKLTELNVNASLALNATPLDPIASTRLDPATSTLVPNDDTRSTATWHLLRHVKANEPGRVSHYIALDSRRKVAVIAVKGTSALSDMVTDACGVAVRYNLTIHPTDTGTKDAADTSAGSTRVISCHEGVLEASLALVDDVQPLVECLFLPAGYRILLVGHSLGAGCACIAGLLLHARMPALRASTSDTTLPLEVIAFAPPPILNQEAALTTSSFITSIVHNDDMIPRSSLSNLVALLRFLSIVNGRLDEKGLRPRGIGGAVKLLKMVLVGGIDTDGDGQADTIMTAEEIFAGLNKARVDSNPDLEAIATASTAAVDNTSNASTAIASTELNTTVPATPLEDMDHLFVPGRVIVIYEKHATTETVLVPSNDALPAETSAAPANASSVPNDNDTSSESTTVAAAIGSSTLATNDSSGPSPESENSSTIPKKSLVDEMRAFISDLLPPRPPLPSPSTVPTTPVEVDAIVANGLTPVLRHIVVNDRMLSDHMVVSYERTLRALLKEPTEVPSVVAT